MLSLDISRAYDSVSRNMLAAILQDAEVPAPLVEAILAVHNQARIQVTHKDYQQEVPLNTGLRQGCGLSPVLWAMVSGWLLRTLPGMDGAEKARTTTVYADDFLCKWIIKSGSALESTHRKIRQVLMRLRDGASRAQSSSCLAKIRGPAKGWSRHALQHS